MMGNMICTSGKLEFSDELGPDDFPTEVKVTITLQHGMPRDKAAIESMFNKGRGRIYALPNGYEQSFASSGQSPVDSSIPSRTSYQRNNPTAVRKEANPDIAHSRLYDANTTNTKPVVANVFGALYGQGYGSKAPVDSDDPPQETPKPAPPANPANEVNGKKKKGH